MKIYTKTGDQGETCLFDGSRTTKDDLRMECMGDIDELGAHLGLIHSQIQLCELQEELLEIIQVLFQINARIAGAVKYHNLDLSIQTKLLEKSIDRLDEKLTPLRNFIYPVGNSIIAKTHITRAICRRAERKLVQVNREFAYDNSTQRYINRLSDWLFTVTRYLAVVYHVDEVAVSL